MFGVHSYGSMQFDGERNERQLCDKLMMRL